MKIEMMVLETNHPHKMTSDWRMPEVLAENLADPRRLGSINNVQAMIRGRIVMLPTIRRGPKIRIESANAKYCRTAWNLEQCNMPSDPNKAK